MPKKPKKSKIKRNQMKTLKKLRKQKKLKKQRVRKLMKKPKVKMSMIPKKQMIHLLVKIHLRLRKMSQTNHLIQKLRMTKILQMIQMILKRKLRPKNLPIQKTSHQRITLHQRPKVQTKIQLLTMVAKLLKLVQKTTPKNNLLTTLNQTMAQQMKPHHRIRQEIPLIMTLQMINSRKVQKVKLKLNQLQTKINRLQKFSAQQYQVLHQAIMPVHQRNLMKVEELEKLRRLNLMTGEEFKILH